MNNEIILFSNKTAIKSNVTKRKKIINKLKRDKWLYILLLPGVLYYIVFKFIPMWGILISFKDYSPYTGFFDSPWIGFENFKTFFINPDFFRLIRNTLMLSLYNIIFFFPFPIILALMINEIRSKFYKKSVETLIYVPHFISWVIIVDITFILCGSDNSIIVHLLTKITGYKVDLLSSLNFFRPVIIIQGIWKDSGWGTIIFLAALANVDMELYEAAIVDGCGRFRQLLHITIPSIKSTIIILLIMRMGSVLDNGFDQIFLMTNALNRQVADVFDTYVYNLGITQGAFSYSTAIGLFKSIVGLLLIQGSNYIAKRTSDSSLF